jgi:hypothetical protein
MAGGAYVTAEIRTSFKGYYRASARQDAALIRSFVQFDGEGEVANARQREIGGRTALRRIAFSAKKCILGRRRIARTEQNLAASLTRGVSLSVLLSDLPGLALCRAGSRFPLRVFLTFDPGDTKLETLIGDRRGSLIATSRRATSSPLSDRACRNLR